MSVIEQARESARMALRRNNRDVKLGRESAPHGGDVAADAAMHVLLQYLQSLAIVDGFKPVFDLDSLEQTYIPEGVVNLSEIGYLIRELDK